MWLPGRRAGLEFVEKLLPTKLTSTDTTERNVMLRVPPRRIGRAGYWEARRPRCSVRVSRSLEEASMDLGADGVQTFRLVTDEKVDWSSSSVR
jgi:hypothetical protein